MTADKMELQVPGYAAPAACVLAGITYRQLDYWATIGFVVPTIQDSHGSGSRRLYELRDILILRIVKRLMMIGVNLPNIRIVVDHLNSQDNKLLSGFTIISNGSSVFECASDQEIIDIVQSGHGFFGIGVDSVCKEVEANLATLELLNIPSERTQQ